MKKKVLISFIIVILVIIFYINYLFLFKPPAKLESANIEVEPMSLELKEKAIAEIQTSEFLRDLPSSGVISLRFYSFVDGARVWHEQFLLGQRGLLNSGNPDMFLILNSKYIDSLEHQDLCDIIRTAKASGDFGFYSEKSSGSLFLKYRSMMKHRACFGF